MNIMSELEKFRDGLEQQRDELRVQAGLAKLEARDEWEKTEVKLEAFKNLLSQLSHEAHEAGDEVWTGVQTLGEDIKMAYERIRKSL
ncbi:MAG: hypothetical protein ACR2HF_13770 [Methylococcaceae bacterium]